jgi:hypothetical protein
MPVTVWAVHSFEAEAEDEISFNIGEPITVLQRDELYQDGWWEVRLKDDKMTRCWLNDLGATCPQLFGETGGERVALEARNGT